MIRVLCLALLSIPLWVFPAPAAAQSLGEVTVNQIEAAPVAERYVNRVRAYVTVSSEDQLPVLDLPADAFSLLEDGQPVALGELRLATDPMSLVMAIDTSGSMQARDASGRTSMELARSAAVDFVSMLGEEDRVALFSFNREPVLHLDFASDRAASVQALQSLEAETRAPTCLYDTAFMAVKKAAEIPAGRRAIVLMTDGKDEKGKGKCSTYSLNDVIDAATTKSIRVPVYTVGVGPKVDAQELSRLARLTGGRSLLAESMDELRRFYEIIADQLKNQYVVAYDTQKPSGEHSLVVKVRHQGVSVQDEKRFWLPPQPVMRPPEVTFTAPDPSDAIEAGESVAVAVSVTPADTVEKVRFYVNASLKAERSEPPFDSFQWDTEGLEGGLHVLRVEAVDRRGQSGYAELTKKVTAPPPPPEPEPSQAPVPAKAPAPAPPPQQPFPLVVALIAGGLLLIVIVGFLWWLGTKKKADASMPPPQADLEDETVFMSDFGDDQRPAPPARVSVEESLVLEAGTSFDFTGRATVGRTDRNDINIPDKPVSRRHGEIYFEQGRYYIRDLGSQNGIRVDGDRIGTDGAPLEEGARIHLGPKTVLVFHGGSPAPPEPDDPDELDDDATKLYEPT